MVFNKKTFWAVKWGDTVRIAMDKTGSPIGAAKECFGMASGDMMVKPLGSNKAKLRTTSWRQSQLESQDGWQELNINNPLGMAI